MFKKTDMRGMSARGGGSPKKLRAGGDLGIGAPGGWGIWELGLI